jgi:hypothetical protein
MCRVPFERDAGDRRDRLPRLRQPHHRFPEHPLRARARRRRRRVPRGASPDRDPGGSAVVVRGSTISVYRAAGAREHSWAIRAPGPPAELVDARGRFAVYSAGIALRLLDLRNGRDVAIGLQRQVDAAWAVFTSGGLAYGYSAGYGDAPFRAGFLPLARLPAMLRSA